MFNRTAFPVTSSFKYVGQDLSKVVYMRDAAEKELMTCTASWSAQNAKLAAVEESTICGDLNTSDNCWMQYLRLTVREVKVCDLQQIWIEVHRQREDYQLSTGA